MQGKETKSHYIRQKRNFVNKVHRAMGIQERQHLDLGKGEVTRKDFMEKVTSQKVFTRHYFHRQTWDERAFKSKEREWLKAQRSKSVGSCYRRINHMVSIEERKRIGKNRQCVFTTICRQICEIFHFSATGSQQIIF